MLVKGMLTLKLKNFNPIKAGIFLLSVIGGGFHVTRRPISALSCQINQISDSSRPNNCIIQMKTAID